MSNFRKRRDEFDRDMKRIESFIIVINIITILFSIGLIGFFIWVIVMIMRYFGII